MKTCFSWKLALLALLAGSGSLFAQNTIVLQSQGDGSAAVVSPMLEEGGGPLFLNQLGPPFPGAAAPNRAQVQGTVNQIGTNSDNQVGTLSVGFDYVTPLWTFRDFLLVVPPANASGFPLLGDTGRVDNHFAFAPRIDYNYRFADSDLGLRASGTFLSLSGQLNRQVGSTETGVGQLTANSQLTIISANLIEFAGEWFWDKIDKRGNERTVVVDASIGTRYSSIDQNYTGSLTNTSDLTSVSTRFSTQSFRGIGLTGSVGYTRPVGTNWDSFTRSRGSILVGENNKVSTVTVNVTGQPGTSSTIEENRTAVLPVLEFETGVRWTTVVREANRGVRPMLFGIEVAFVSQYWPDVGPLSAGSTQQFRRSDLFLLGVSVLAGFDF